MLDKKLTADEERRTFDAVLVRALTDGQRCSLCSGLHPDVLDAIDAVASVAQRSAHCRCVDGWALVISSAPITR